MDFRDLRVGIGYDVHRLQPDRPLILGGVHIPQSLGLLGHSDADVLVHALMDAMLGALSLGDIGRHFPPEDEAFRGISSLVLLQRVKELAFEKGYRLHNADCTVIAQLPKISPFFPEMREKLAGTLGVPVEAVSVKATTTEGLGLTGRQEGIACQAIASMISE
ncbi:MAG TPA: 2-C-methyl-D-erythritol 2,4-cyclodiphosphate synthase [Chroococcales cyanobacterium]